MTIAAMFIAMAALFFGLLSLRMWWAITDRVAALEGADDEEAEEGEPESAELWVSDGDLHTMDQTALYEATGAIALCVSEGVPCAVVKGVGVVSLHKLLSEKPKVQAIK